MVYRLQEGKTCYYLRENNDVECNELNAVVGSVYYNEDGELQVELILSRAAIEGIAGMDRENTERTSVLIHLCWPRF